MKITEVRLGMISVPLRVPFKTALRSVNSVEDVVVEIHTDTGAVGYGEAPPTGVITGDTTGAIIGAMKDHIIKTLVGRDVDDFESVTKALNGCIVHNTSARAAADMALWDLYGQLHNIPVYKLLGGGRSSIVTDITISVNKPEEMQRDAINAVERGYDCLKVKVGSDPSLDVARLSAIREVVPKDICIRIDANQGWTPKQAVRIISMLEDANLDAELVEQPVKAGDLEGMRYVTQRVYTPILADESVFTPADAIRILESGAANLVNIKLMKTGGLYNAMSIASIARALDAECMMGCMLEGNVAVTAAAHAAMARGSVTRIDLDGPALCTENPVHGGAQFNGSRITLPDAPGLGITDIDGLVPFSL